MTSKHHTIVFTILYVYIQLELELHKRLLDKDMADLTHVEVLSEWWFATLMCRKRGTMCPPTQSHGWLVWTACSAT